VSVLDQFRTAEEQVAKRLRELKPLVAEYYELEQVAQRLGLSLSEDATVTNTPRPASPKSTRRRRRASTTKPRSTTKARSATASREESGNGATAQTSAAATQTRRVRSPRSAAHKGRSGSARSSRREQDILRLVQQRPGITVSQIAKELEVDATGLYRPVHKLEQRGAISKQGAALQPANR
jgi:MarR family